MSKIHSAIRKAQTQSTHRRAPFATTAPDPYEILTANTCETCGQALPEDENPPEQLELLHVPAFLRRQAD